MAGTVTQTRDQITVRGKAVAEIITFSWTSTAGGAADAATSAVVNGRLCKVVTNPGATAPTDDYDITITDSDGADVMGGACANRDTANSEQAVPSGGTNDLSWVRVDSILTLNVSAAGDSKQGTVKLFVELDR